MTAQPVTMWAVIDRDGKPVPDTIYPTRRRTMDRFIAGRPMSWADCKAAGYRVARVTVSEVQDAQ